MDLVLRKISCEDRLPVSVVEDTFEIMCDGKHRCAFQQDTSALITGQLVLNGFENYASDSTYVVVAGTVDTLTRSHQVRKALDLCSSASGYGDNGYGCPSDGTYDFSISFDMPGNGGWFSSGFDATADLEMVATDGTLIGTCVMLFATPAQSFLISSKIVFFTSISILGLVLFVAVFLGFGQQVFTAYNKRQVRHFDDESTVTKDDKTVLSGNLTNNEVEAVDDSGTFDDATRSTWSYGPSIYSGATTVQQETQSTAASQHVAKIWRIGGLLVDRLINGKPLRTPPTQPQRDDTIDDRSNTSYSTSTDYHYMENRPDSSVHIHNGTAHQDYSQLEDESTIELPAISSSCSIIDLNCDSMDVQATDRRSRSRFACGANDISDHTNTTDAMQGIHTAAEIIQAWFSKGDISSEAPTAPPQPEEEVRDEYHNMNVYTIGDGNQAQYSGRVLVNEGNPVAYVPSSSDDSTRDDSGADDNSIVPVAPRRQADRLNVKPEYHYKESESKRTSPSKKRLMTSYDSISINKVVHGNQIRGNIFA